jgi:hypothetical protein
LRGDFVAVNPATAAPPTVVCFDREILGHVLGTPPLNLTQRFGVTVAWKIERALEAVHELASARISEPRL